VVGLVDVAGESIKVGVVGVGGVVGVAASEGYGALVIDICDETQGDEAV